MKKHLIRLGLILLAASLLTPFIRDFVRDAIIIPFLYLFWLGSFFVKAVPQQWLWTGFLGLCLLILAVSLINKRKHRPKPAPIKDFHQGRIERWAKLLEQARQDDYFKWRLAQHLQNLALNAIAHQNGQSIKQIRLQMRLGELDMPPDLAAYFQASLKPLGHLPAPKRLLQLKTRPPSPLDLDPAYVIQYLEVLNADVTAFDPEIRLMKRNPEL